MHATMIYNRPTNLFGRLRRAFVHTLLAIAVVGTTEAAERRSPIKLFNGENLEGWYSYTV